MSRRAALFTEADIFRAAKAAKRAGMAVEINLRGGLIRIVPPETTGQAVEAEPSPRPLPPSQPEDYVF